MIGLIISLLAAFTFIHVSIQKKIFEGELGRRISLMREKLVERGKAISDNLARQTENGIAAYNFSNVTEVVRKSVKDNEDTSYAVLMDVSGLAYIHTLRPELEQEILLHEDDIFAASRDKATVREYERNDSSFMEFIVPVNVSTERWGVLRIGFSLDLLNNEIASSKRDILKQIRNLIIRSVITSLIFILIGVLIVFMVSTRLSKPLIRLTESARELAGGNFGIAENIKIKSEDEIGILARAFVQMSKDIKTSHEKLEDYGHTLEQKVEDRTFELKVANKKLQELDVLKTDFLSTVSHELRTPLALVLGFARIIGKRLDDFIFPLVRVEDAKTKKAIGQVKENINIIVLEGKRLTSLINDLLDISKMEAGKIEWDMELLSLAEVVERATASVGDIAEDSGLEIKKDFEEGVPEVMGDRNRLIQVIINLVSNALKFTKKGSITCEVRKMEREVVVSVIDTGVGIAEPDMKSVFEKFKQAGASLTDKPKGTGLGLTICKQIVEHHGGRIWVESELAKGSVFSFSIPCSRRLVEK